MHAKRLIAALVPAALALSAPLAHAGVALIGIGQISGSDLSGLKGTLENGTAANILGGLGSGMASRSLSRSANRFEPTMSPSDARWISMSPRVTAIARRRRSSNPSRPPP